MSEPRIGNAEAGVQDGQPVMEDVRPLKVETLKARIGASAYEVDPREVAAAMLRRPETRLWLVTGGPRGSSGGPPDQAK
jgi:anti-sigma28 factor (negative regulator of flagellin synthesis)